MIGARPLGDREPHAVCIASALNLRDIGGCPTRDGRVVRAGLLYRSGSLSRLTPDDAAQLIRLGIRTVYDLRSEAEREARPDRLPEEVGYRVADVLGEAASGVFERLGDVLSHPDRALNLVGDGRGISLWIDQYRDLVRLPSARTAYARLFSGIAGDSVRPALFHCAAGKDRTGWAAAALLMLLDVPYEAVMEGFLRSNALLQALTAQVSDAFAAKGGDPELLQPILGVRPEYLDAARDEMVRSFANVDGYFAVGLKLDAESRRALREALLEPG